MKVLVAEHRIVDRSTLVNAVGQHPSISFLVCAASPMEMQTWVEKSQPDVVFLAENWPNWDPLDWIKQNHFGPKTVLVSDYISFETKALQLGCLDFMFKPIRQERVNRALDLVENHVESSAYSHGFRPDLNVHDIVEISDELPHSIIYLNDGTKMLSERAFMEWEGALCKEWFFRINRETVVNRRFIMDCIQEPCGLVMLETKFSHHMVERSQHLQFLNWFARKNAELALL